MEPQRLQLHVPDTAFLSIDLTLPESIIGKIGSLDVSASGESEDGTNVTKEREVDRMKVRGQNAGETLRLKRLGKAFDVDAARAEWQVAERKLIVTV